MRMTATIEVKRNDFPKIAKGLRSGADEIQAQTILMIVQTADPQTPVDTGNLKNNKTIETGGGGQPGFIHWHAAYAWFVHNGTSRMPARPFAASAAAQVWPLFQTAMQELCARGGL